jgi:glycosyltransferase involved in cell wall biosynthesis
VAFPAQQADDGPAVILCIAPRRWDSLWKETQAIMSRLAPDNRVLYVEPGRDPEHGVVAEWRRNLPNLFRLRMGEVRENLFVIPSPPVLPHGRRHLPPGLLRWMMPPVVGVNARLLTLHVRRALRALAVTSPILWLTDPYQVGLVGRCRERLACYFNFDEFADIAANRRVSPYLARLDAELTRRVDVVFATSRAQCERRRTINPRSHLIPNGVDFDVFARAVTEELPIPADLAAVPRPIIGFVGWLTEHIDVAVLRRIAETHSNCSLVLVGPGQLPAGPDLDALRARPNVVFLGRKDHADVPRYLRMFDVALMPYRPIGHVLSAYPAKLHEYLAAGRPVVATALPELRPYRAVVRLAETADDFTAMVGQALRDHSPAAIDARLAVARQNTWDARVAEIRHILGLSHRRTAPPA